MSYLSLSDLVQTKSGVGFFQLVGVDKIEQELPKFPLFFKALQEVEALAKMSNMDGLPFMSIFSQGEYTDGSVDFYPMTSGTTRNTTPFLTFHWDALNDAEADESIGEYSATNDPDDWHKMLGFINRYRDHLTKQNTSKVSDTGVSAVSLVDIIVMFLRRAWEPGCYLSWGRSMKGKGLEVYLVPPTRDAEYIINIRFPIQEQIVEPTAD